MAGAPARLTDAQKAHVGAGCLDDDGYVRAQPAGGLLARREVERAMQIAHTTSPDVQTAMVAPIVLDRLGKRAAQLGDDAAIHRFAVSAGKALAALANGMSAEGRTRQVIAAARCHAEAGPPRSEPRAVRDSLPAGRA